MGLNHGTKVLMDLVRPIANTDRVIVADSYFASVQSAKELFSMGLRFIGTVKTATKNFPMNFLQRVLLPGGKGDSRSLITKDPTTGMAMVAFVWADRDRRYFITTCLSTAPGKVIKKRRWRQRDETPNADPVLEYIEIQQTEAGQVYYEGCSKIDQHNRLRQDSLNLEKKLQTMDWATRANHSILGMIVVDSFYLATGCQGAFQGGFRFYLEDLITGLIENKYDQRTLRKRREESIKEEAAISKTGAGMILDTHR